LAGSQIISRLYLRGKKAWWAKAYRKLADFWLGLSPILLLTLLGFEAIVAMTDLPGRHAAFWVIGIALAGGTFGVVVAIRPFVKSIRFKSDKLARPVRFVQITDVHIGSRSPAFLNKVIADVNRQDPDFLCITGDFIDASGVPESSLIALKTVSCPIYFCIGNHEKYEDLDDILARLTNLGVRVLRNETLMHGDCVQVIGIDDMDDDKQVERELSQINVSTDSFVLLLYHRPRGLEAAAEAGVDLMLSGHTHNGQIFPFNLVVRRVFDRIVGMYQHGNARLYVSQGTGTWGPIMRVGTRSEITLFDLSPE
jgi:predicted MPP superfamily phosphohydrolase